MSTVLFKDAKIINEGPHKGTNQDVLVEDGRIIKIDQSISIDADVIISSDQLHLSGGWCDIGCYNGEPGFEYREDLGSLRRAASHGGYTHIAPLPTSFPPLQSSSQIDFLRRLNEYSSVKILPIAALSHELKGISQNDLLDLSHSGAVAFSDIHLGTEGSGFLSRSLEYIRETGRPIIEAIYHPHHSDHGVVNEGAVSVSLGLPGIPTADEMQQVHRLIEQAVYSNGNLIIHQVSLATAVELISEVKGTCPIDATVSAMNLLHSDEVLSTWDATYKVLPPLRSEQNRITLCDYLNKGLISVITSNHMPLSKEEKDEPFGQSAFGASMLDHVFSVLNTYGQNLDHNQVIYGLSNGPYKALGLSAPIIQEGEVANLTAYDPSLPAVCDTDFIQSKNHNTPYLNTTLRGIVLATFNSNILVQNT
ncbi:MAG: hypothetical protein AAFR14_07665 [Bacteroidota bacterium]